MFPLYKELKKKVDKYNFSRNLKADVAFKQLYEIGSNAMEIRANGVIKELMGCLQENLFFGYFISC